MSDIKFSEFIAIFDIRGVLLLTIYSKLRVQISNIAINSLNSIFTPLNSNIHGMSDIEFSYIRYLECSCSHHIFEVKGFNIEYSDIIAIFDMPNSLLEIASCASHAVMP